MPRSYRGTVVALGLIFSALLGLGGASALLYRAGQLQTGYEHQAEAKAHAYSERAHIATEGRCRRLPAEGQAQCVHEENEAARQGRHNEYELQAQLVTSVWTEYMGIAAIAGTGFGIVGITLVLATFWENKRAADAAHDANRPWIEVTLKQLRLGISREGGGSITADAILKNHGNSPATNVFADTVVMATPWIAFDGHVPAIDPIVPMLKARLDRLDRSIVRSGTTIFPSGDEKQHVSAECDSRDMLSALGENEHIRWLVAVGVSYRFGANKGRTVQTYEISLRPNEVNYGLADTEHRVLVGQGDLIDTYEGFAT